MPQVTQRRITTSDHLLADAVMGLLPGMTAILLTGAGWIRVLFTATLQNQSNIAGPVQFEPEIDDAVNPPAMSTDYCDTIVGYGYRRISHEWFYRLGAGQHCFKMYGQSYFQDTKIIRFTGIMTIWELGF